MTQYFEHQQTGKRYVVVSVDAEKGAMRLKGEHAEFDEPNDQAHFQRMGYVLRDGDPATDPALPGAASQPFKQAEITNAHAPPVPPVSTGAPPPPPVTTASEIPPAPAAPPPAPVDAAPAGPAVPPPPPSTAALQAPSVPAAPAAPSVIGNGQVPPPPVASVVPPPPPAPAAAIPPPPPPTA